MLKLSLDQFHCLFFEISELSEHYGFREKDFCDIKIYLSDPDEKGRIGMDITFPKYYTLPENASELPGWRDPKK